MKYPLHQGFLKVRIVTANIVFLQIITILGINGLLIGLLMGILQWLVLCQVIKVPKSWIIATIFGCLFAEIFGGTFAVGLPFGLFLLHGEGWLG